MSPTTHTRRTLLALCGGSPATPALAGCLDRETEYEQWRDGDRIVLDTYTDRWEGIAPGMIGGEIDPLLVLPENNEYELVWRNADGDPDTVALCDEDGRVLRDYVSESTGRRERRTLRFRALQGIGTYVFETGGDMTFGPIDLHEGSDTSAPPSEAIAR